MFNVFIFGFVFKKFTPCKHRGLFFVVFNYIVQWLFSLLNHLFKHRRFGCSILPLRINSMRNHQNNVGQIGQLDVYLASYRDAESHLKAQTSLILDYQLGKSVHHWTVISEAKQA